MNKHQQVKAVVLTTAVSVSALFGSVAHAMLDALEQFVELDVPNQLAVRREEIAKVRDNLSRADFTIAEKFRQVLELYSIEGEAGRRIETYSDTLDVGGAEREVDVLAVGIFICVYRSR